MCRKAFFLIFLDNEGYHMESYLWKIKDRLTELIFWGMAIAVPIILLTFVLYPVLRVSLSSIYDGGQFSLKFYEQLFLT